MGVSQQTKQKRHSAKVKEINKRKIIEIERVKPPIHTPSSTGRSNCTMEVRASLSPCAKRARAATKFSANAPSYNTNSNILPIFNRVGEWVAVKRSCFCCERSDTQHCRDSNTERARAIHTTLHTLHTTHYTTRTTHTTHYTTHTTHYTTHPTQTNKPCPPRDVEPQHVRV